jgi:hypothetical protein
VQHAVRIALHSAASLVLWLVLRNAILACALGGPCGWLAFAVKEAIRPSDPEPLTMWQHIADWLNDCALSCVPLVIAIGCRDAFAGVLLGGACVSAYIGCHKDARP